MDNIVDRAVYPLFEQEKEAKSKRRMGLGVTGLANCLEAMGWSYGSDNFLEAEGDILSRLCHDAYRASAMLAEEKGSFPMFNRESYLMGHFVQELPYDVRELIAAKGMRKQPPHQHRADWHHQPLR